MSDAPPDEPTLDTPDEPIPTPPSDNPIGNPDIPIPVTFSSLDPDLEAITREGDPLGNVTRFEFNSLVNIVQQIRSIVTPSIEPPSVVDVPFAQQEDAVLTCTMGNWTGEPTVYAYQWMHDDQVVGDTATYTLIDGDVGKAFVCVVTATNGGGSTTAPPSNVVEVTDPSATTTRRRR